MQKLNLNIFSEETEIESKTPKSPNPPESTPTRKPKFIPVGFHQEHLRLLDEAVLKLRHQGHWKASKSGIIRRLIEVNRDSLADFIPDQK